MTKEQTLLPCPFCGDSQLGQMQMTSFDETPPRKWMRVKCDTCGAMAPDTAWNQRNVAIPKPSDDVKRFAADEAIHAVGQRGPMVVLASDYDKLLSAASGHEPSPPHPGPSIEKAFAQSPRRVWHFDRYRNGQLMAQGVQVQAANYADAYDKATKLLFIDGNKPTDELRLTTP